MDQNTKAIITSFTKNRRIGQFVGELANRAKLANSLVQYTRIRESERLANPVLQIALSFRLHLSILLLKENDCS